MADDNVVPIRSMAEPVLPPTLATERLRLRPLTLADAADILAYAGDAAMTRYLLWDAHRSLGDTEVFLREVRERYARGEPYDWGIETEGKVVGTIGLFDRNLRAERMEVGFALARTHWRRGIMREALTAVLDHAFCTLALRRVVARSHVENVGSRALLAAVGFQHEGTLRQDVYAKGLFWDVSYFGLLVGEFNPTRRPTERRRKGSLRSR